MQGLFDLNTQICVSQISLTLFITQKLIKEK